MASRVLSLCYLVAPMPMLWSVAVPVRRNIGSREVLMLETILMDSLVRKQSREILIVMVWTT